MAALGIEPVNQVRFIWFSGEEQGLLGSDFYVNQLTKAQRNSISAMLDFDMLASPNYAQQIYDGDGSENLLVSGEHSQYIKRLAVFAFIYEGVPNWAAADGVFCCAMPGRHGTSARESCTVTSPARSPGGCGWQRISIVPRASRSAGRRSRAASGTAAPTSS